MHKDLETIKLAALHYAKEHKCNYNIIILNPNDKGEFDPITSTYELVTDSYFDKLRENAIILFRTDELISEEVRESFEHPLPISIHKLMDFGITNHLTPIDKWIPTRPPQYIRETPKIQRNSLCTCGSGKKYKKCCGSN